MATRAGHCFRESPLSLVPGEVGGVKEIGAEGEGKARHYRAGLARHAPFLSLFWLPGLHVLCELFLQRFLDLSPLHFPTAELCFQRSGLTAPPQPDRHGHPTKVACPRPQSNQSLLPSAEYL